MANNRNEKILVEIASYRDPELLNTVHSALLQADYPDRISFSICYQDNNVDGYEQLKKIKNCKVKWLKEHETKGSCYARFLCQKMIDDEKYIYQIDSHMRFIKHWDTKLIEQLLSFNDSKAIISFYPPNCTEEMMSLPLDDKIFDHPSFGGLMYASGFRDDSLFVEVKSEIINNDDPRAYKRSVFISAGNFFSFSDVHKEVFHDPEMYFYGDEVFMDINLFTHGWNVYNSGECYIYHQYNRKNQVFPKLNNVMKNEAKKFAKLFNKNNQELNIKEFALGTERTVSEFEKFSGIDFAKKIIYLNAETGEIENDNYINKISYFYKQTYENDKYLDENYNIEVIIVDVFGDYKKCIKTCLDNAVYKGRVSFIVGTTKSVDISDEDCLNMHIKKIVYFNSQNSYSEIVNKLSSYLGNDYVTIIDSSVRFLNGWDKYLCDSIKMCGQKAALTSWVWQTDNEENIKMSGYDNIVKEFDHFYYHLPVLQYNKEIDLKKMIGPYQTTFISNGFLFCHSSIVKTIEFDPNLNYYEQQYIYGIRLWTNGINIYYPKLSYMIRTKDEKLLNSNKKNIDVVCALSGIKNSYSKSLQSDYSYDIGSERPLWMWYQFLNIDYDLKNKQLIEKE